MEFTTTNHLPASSGTWRIPPAAWVAIAFAIIAEATSNALRAYGLGAHLEAFTVTYAGASVSVAGGVLVLAAVAISLSQARAAWVALTPGVLRQRLVAGAAAVLLLSVSVTAMVSHILEAQRSKVADEGDQRKDYDRAESEYGNLLIQLEALKKYGDDGKQLPRAAGVIQAAIDKLPIDMAVWRRTARCTDVTKPESKTACQPVLDHYEERGARIALDALQPKLDAAVVRLAKLKRPEEIRDVEASVAGGWAWIMGLGVVFVATFGPVIFARVEAAPSASDRRQTSFAASDSAELAGLSGALRSDRPSAYQRGREPAAPEKPDRPGPGGVIGRRKPDGPAPGGRWSKSDAERFVVTELALGRTIPSQQSIVEKSGRRKSTVSDWFRGWEADGIIPARQQAGRCKMLAGE